MIRKIDFNRSEMVHETVGVAENTNYANIASSNYMINRASMLYISDANDSEVMAKTGGNKDTVQPLLKSVILCCIIIEYDPLSCI